MGLERRFHAAWILQANYTSTYSDNYDPSYTLGNRNTGGTHESVGINDTTCTVVSTEIGADGAGGERRDYPPPPFRGTNGATIPREAAHVQSKCLMKYNGTP